MKGKGQYIYVHLSLSSEIDPNAEPAVKFNDGYFGGSHDVRWKGEKNDKGVALGLD